MLATDLILHFAGRWQVLHRRGDRGHWSIDRELAAWRTDRGAYSDEEIRKHLEHRNISDVRYAFKPAGARAAKAHNSNTDTPATRGELSGKLATRRDWESIRHIALWLSLLKKYLGAALPSATDASKPALGVELTRLHPSTTDREWPALIHLGRNAPHFAGDPSHLWFPVAKNRLQARKRLMDTGAATYLQDSNNRHENYLGVCVCKQCQGRTGLNLHGHYLMILRQRLINAHQQIGEAGGFLKRERDLLEIVPTQLPDPPTRVTTSTMLELL